MSFFPSDWDDELDEDMGGFQGDLDVLAKDFESQSRESFTARELMELFRYYSSQMPEQLNAFHSEKYAKMVIELGIQTFPYISIFTLHMVEWLMSEGKYRKAHKYLEQATAYTPFEPTLLMMKAVLHGHEGARKLAFDAMKSALEVIGDDEGPLGDFLDMVLHYEQYDLAEPIAMKALETQAEIIPIFERHINKTEDTNIVMLLIPVIEAQIDKEPYLAEAWQVLGEAYSIMEDHEKALNAFDYAVTINEKYIEAWLGWIEAAYELEYYPKVVARYEELLNEFPPKILESVRGLYAWSLYEVGRLAECREMYKKILTIDSNDSESWYSLGLTYHQEGKYGTAIGYLEKARQLDATQSDYGIVLASAYFGNHQTEKWQALYEELTENFPFEPELWLDYGLALHETGEMDKALDVTETGLENNPHSVPLLYRLAALCYLNGNHDLGLLVLEKALEFDSTEYPTMFNFAPELKASTKIMALIAKFSK